MAINYTFDLSVNTVGKSVITIHENNIRDVERLVELGLVGIDDLAKQAIGFVSHQFFDRVRVEYYAGHILYGENHEKILEARRQVLSQYGHANSDFPTLDQVVLKMYGAQSFPVSNAMRFLFTEEFTKVRSNLQVLYRELLEETLRIMTDLRNMAQLEDIRHDVTFNNIDPIV